MKTNRKAQFSTYLKPVLVIVFGLLMVMVVQQVLSFQISIGEEEAGMDFVSQMKRDFQKISNCLKYTGYEGGRYVVSSDKLEEYEEEYSFREPPCAEDFEYGYAVNVSTRCDLVNTGISCFPEEYVFGERNGSEGRSLEEELTLTYPVLLRQDENNVPAEIKITMRDGELERLSGGYNRVIKKGVEHGVFNMTYRISNEKTYCTSGSLLCVGNSAEHCTELRQEVPEMTLEPGSHILRFSYHDGSIKEVRGVSSDEGCS